MPAHNFGAADKLWSHALHRANAKPCVACPNSPASRWRQPPAPVPATQRVSPAPDRSAAPRPIRPGHAPPARYPLPGPGRTAPGDGAGPLPGGRRAVPGGLPAMPVSQSDIEEEPHEPSRPQARTAYSGDSALPARARARKRPQDAVRSARRGRDQGLHRRPRSAGEPCRPWRRRRYLRRRRRRTPPRGAVNGAAARGAPCVRRRRCDAIEFARRPHH